MNAMVTCSLTGGDHDPREIELPLMYCRDTLGYERDTWFARARNGDVAVMKGGKRIAADWLVYFADVYEKVGTVKANRVEYRYVRTDQINRCEATTKKGTRCRNEAINPATRCRAHQVPAEATP